MTISSTGVALPYQHVVRILKFLNEMLFKEWVGGWRWLLNVCGLGHSGFQPFIVIEGLARQLFFKHFYRYLESQYVSGPYLGWADLDKSPYLYRDVDGDLLSPPKGMRSAVPLGGECIVSFSGPPGILSRGETIWCSLVPRPTRYPLTRRNNLV